jgi:hypothetical protein
VPPLQLNSVSGQDAVFGRDVVPWEPADAAVMGEDRLPAGRATVGSWGVGGSATGGVIGAAAILNWNYNIDRGLRGVTKGKARERIRSLRSGGGHTSN